MKKAMRKMMIALTKGTTESRIARRFHTLSFSANARLSETKNTRNQIASTPSPEES
ncbi:hypothetical protein IMZ31_23600 (plasmid) [Pontibacillus sp. ALD_SL1]|nr:hypothetical protein IMZ31_23600 [Pontibacillus sp. ALD_SL1]